MVLENPALSGVAMLVSVSRQSFGVQGKCWVRWGLAVELSGLRPAWTVLSHYLFPPVFFSQESGGRGLPWLFMNDTHLRNLPPDWWWGEMCRESFGPYFLRLHEFDLSWLRFRKPYLKKKITLSHLLKSGEHC